MTQMLTKIHPDVVSTIVSYFNEHLDPLLVTDVSRYAPGRRRLWLQYEAPLAASRPWLPGHRDQRIWTYIQSICRPYRFSPDFGLVSKGGQIGPHRDASALCAHAVSINLGSVTWCMGEKEQVEKIDLVGGEVFSFNSKNVHWVENVDPQRWAINLWNVSNIETQRYQQIKIQYPLSE